MLGAVACHETTTPDPTPDPTPDATKIMPLPADAGVPDASTDAGPGDGGADAVDAPPDTPEH